MTISTKIHASQHEKLFYLKWKNRNRPKHLAIVEWVDQLYRKVIQQGRKKAQLLLYIKNEYILEI